MFLYNHVKRKTLTKGYPSVKELGPLIFCDNWYTAWIIYQLSRYIGTF